MTIETITGVLREHELMCRPVLPGQPSDITHTYRCGCGWAPIGNVDLDHRHHVAEQIAEALGLTEVTLPHSHIHPCGETGCTIESVTYWRTPDVPAERRAPATQEAADAIRDVFARLGHTSLPIFGTYEPPECRHERTYDDSTWTSAMTRCADCGHVIDQDET